MDRWGFEPSLPLVLVVDPMPAILRALARCLRGEFEIESAGSFAEALAVAKRRKLDLVLTELILPDGDGLQLAGMSRQMDHRCPVLLVTTWETETCVIDAIKDRLIAAVVPKPWDNGALVKDVRRWKARPLTAEG